MRSDDFFLQAVLAAMKVVLHDAESRSETALTPAQIRGVAERSVQAATALHDEVDRGKLVTWDSA